MSDFLLALVLLVVAGLLIILGLCTILHIVQTLHEIEIKLGALSTQIEQIRNKLEGEEIEA